MQANNIMTIDSKPPTIPQYPHDINNSLAVDTNIRISSNAAIQSRHRRHRTMRHPAYYAVLRYTRSAGSNLARGTISSDGRLPR